MEAELSQLNVKYALTFLVIASGLTMWMSISKSFAEEEGTWRE